jgi:hypothetical protein
MEGGDLVLAVATEQHDRDRAGVLAGQRAAGRVDGATDVRHDHLLVKFGAATLLWELTSFRVCDDLVNESG